MVKTEINIVYRKPAQEDYYYSINQGFQNKIFFTQTKF